MTISEHVCGLRVIPLKGRINRKESGYMKRLCAVSSRPLLIEKHKQESEAQTPAAQVTPGKGLPSVLDLCPTPPPITVSAECLHLGPAPPLQWPLPGPFPKQR